MSEFEHLTLAEKKALKHSLLSKIMKLKMSIRKDQNKGMHTLANTLKACKYKPINGSHTMETIYRLSKEFNSTFDCSGKSEIDYLREKLILLESTM